MYEQAEKQNSIHKFLSNNIEEVPDSTRTTIPNQLCMSWDIYKVNNISSKDARLFSPRCSGYWQVSLRLKSYQ